MTKDVEMLPLWINRDKRYIIFLSGEVHSVHAERKIAFDTYRELVWGNEVDVAPEGLDIT